MIRRKMIFLLMLYTYIAHSTEISFDPNDDMLRKLSFTTAQKLQVKEFVSLNNEFEQDLISSKSQLLKVNADIIENARNKNFTALNCVANFYLEGAILRKNEQKGTKILLWLAKQHDSNAIYNLYELCKQKGFTEQSSKWRHLAQNYGHLRILEEELED